MKRYVMILVTFSFLIFPHICFPSYVIELESGSEIVVDHHWMDNGKMAFYFHGGVVAIPRHLVRKIRQSNLSPGEEYPSLTQPDTAQQGDGESTLTSGKTGDPRPDDRVAQVEADSKANGKPKEASLEYYKGQRRLLKSELEEATRRFRQASSSKDLQAKQEAIRDMTRISKKLYDLGKELEAKNKGELPDWWQ